MGGFNNINRKDSNYEDLQLTTILTTNERKIVICKLNNSTCEIIDMKQAPDYAPTSGRPKRV